MTLNIEVARAVRKLPRVGPGALRSGALMLAAVVALVVGAPASAQEYDAPIATLVKNMDQPSGPDIRSGLSKYQDGVMQGFRTGPVPAAMNWRVSGCTCATRTRAGT